MRLLSWLLHVRAASAGMRRDGGVVAASGSRDGATQRGTREMLLVPWHVFATRFLD